MAAAPASTKALGSFFNHWTVHVAMTSLASHSLRSWLQAAVVASFGSAASSWATETTPSLLALAAKVALVRDVAVWGLTADCSRRRQLHSQLVGSTPRVAAVPKLTRSVME
jgi:hypothetical protein